MGKRIVKIRTGLYIDPERVVSVHEDSHVLGVSMDNGMYYDATDYQDMVQLLDTIWPGYTVEG